jgi:pimeloyl-ACP methyl ester carboxylesterase
VSERTIHVRGADLACTDRGDGPLVVSLHGLMQHRQPDRLAGVIDPGPLVAAGFRVVAYDARGHGRSSGEADPHAYAWGELALDLLDLVDQLAPDRPAYAMGVSMGTGTLLNALAIAPARFAGVVLGAPPTAGATRRAQAGVYHRLADLLERDGYEAWAAMAEQAPPPEIFAGRQAEMGRPTPAPELAPAILRGAAASDLPAGEELAALRVPALVLAWDTDPGHPLSTANALARTLPDATLHVSADVGDINRWGEYAARFLSQRLR